MADSSWDRLLESALDQAGRRGIAEHLLKEWLDIHDEPCHYDHHGYCQAHFLEEKGECIVERTRNFLESKEQ